MTTTVKKPTFKRRAITIAAGILLGAAGALIVIATVDTSDDVIQKSAQTIQAQVAKGAKVQASAPTAAPTAKTPAAAVAPQKPTELSASGVPVEYDTNKDGKVSIQEVYDATLAKVLGFDKDSDGKLDLPEFAASISASVTDDFAKEAFAEIDTDKDSFLSKDEIGNYVGPGISDMDKDGDGLVDPLPSFQAKK